MRLLTKSGTSSSTFSRIQSGTRLCAFHGPISSPSLISAAPSHAMTIVDSSSKPLPDQTPREGVYLLMEVHIPPTSDTSHKPTSRPLERISAVDPDAHRVAWVNLMPRWFLRAERWQALSTVEDGKTLYETREVMAGPGAWLVRWFFRAGLDEGFEAVARGLKSRAEQL
ncbi:hypothetical protein AcV5_010271 [Taiwanofungus camphoratus]|nr:hypothetical protein AcV5_010271 [Antrodia cinnamomea]KAI0946248.1 hypothetical protein AcV7_010277 [Antrodia cinnamomea]